MTDSADLDARLVAYVDGELDAAEAAGIERLIAGDARVRADVEMFRTTAMLLRAACGEQHYAQVPPRPAAAAAPRGRRIGRRGTAMALAAGVLLMLGGFAGGAWWQGHDSNALLAEIAEYHTLISRETTHLAELPADRADEFVAWMGERLDRRLRVPDLGAAGLRYSGGRMLVIDGAPVADFLYTRDDGPPVALCITRADGVSRPLRVVQRGDLRLASWSEGHAVYVVVGDLDAAAAHRIADLVAGQIAG